MTLARSPSIDVEEAIDIVLGPIPEAKEIPVRRVQSDIDYDRLLLQWLIVVLLGYIGFHATGKSKREH